MSPGRAHPDASAGPVWRPQILPLDDPAGRAARDALLAEGRVQRRVDAYPQMLRELVALDAWQETPDALDRRVAAAAGKRRWRGFFASGVSRRPSSAGGRREGRQLVDLGVGKRLPRGRRAAARKKRRQEKAGSSAASAAADAGGAGAGSRREFLEQARAAYEYSMRHFLYSQAAFYAERLLAEGFFLNFELN